MKSIPMVRAVIGRSVVSAGTLLFSLAAYSQEFTYIIHKPTGLKFYSCSSADDSPVIAFANSDTSTCSHWERVPIDDFFHLRSRESNKHIRPRTADDGSAIVTSPNTWRGNWNQWSHVPTINDAGYLVNRGTRKHVFVREGGEGQELELRPSSWRGDYTQWIFESVSSPTPSTPSPLPEPTPTLVATPNPDMTRVEAESGSTFGVARTYTDPAASGGGGVAFISEIGSGFSLTNVPASNSITIAYASALSGEISIRINGEDEGNIAFETTGDFVGAYTSVTANLVVPQNATFDIFYDAGDAAMNVDFVEFNRDLSPATPTPSPNPNPIGNTVEIVSDPNLGDFLVAGFGERQGFTLYTFINDNVGPSTCFGGCAGVWPPFIVESTDQLTPTSLDLGTSERPDGSLQVTYNGEPLYFYTPDNQPGDTSGHGAGDVWFVADLIDAPANAMYDMVFTSNWRAHGPLPNNAHFTRFVGSTHNGSVSFFSNGGIATSGVEQVAETGRFNIFNGEVNDAIQSGSATQFINGPDLFLLRTSSRTLTVENIMFDISHPLLSMVTMIAPSPDWMVAFSNLSLIDSAGNWVDEIAFDVFPYDAGTEEGNSYSLNNPATEPREPIRSVQGIAPFNNEPIGRVVITRMR